MAGSNHCFQTCRSSVPTFENLANKTNLYCRACCWGIIDLLFSVFKMDVILLLHRRTRFLARKASQRTNSRRRSKSLDPPRDRLSQILDVQRSRTRRLSVDSRPPWDDSLGDEVDVETQYAPSLGQQQRRKYLRHRQDASSSSKSTSKPSPRAKTVQDSGAHSDESNKNFVLPKFKGNSDAKDQKEEIEKTPLTSDDSTQDRTERAKENVRQMIAGVLNLHADNVKTEESKKSEENEVVKEPPSYMEGLSKKLFSLAKKNDWIAFDQALKYVTASIKF